MTHTLEYQIIVPPPAPINNFLKIFQPLTIPNFISTPLLLISKYLKVYFKILTVFP